MDNDPNDIKAILANYEYLIELSLKERKCLVTIDIECLLQILKEKEICLNELNNHLDRIKSMWQQKFQIQAYKTKLMELSSRFLFENNINAKIAQQHLSFSHSLLNLYSNFIQVNETYNKKAYLPSKSSFSKIV